MSVFKITKDCIGCGICEDACENEAIISGARNFIDTEKCIKCEACMDECPMDAIIEVE